MYFDDLNEVKVLGNLTNDPELRFTPSGAAVLNFSLATNRRYKQGETWSDEVTYHNVVVWGTLAQGLATRAKKGTRVLVDGRLQTRTWDGPDGKKNYKTEIVGSNVLLLDRYNKDVTDAAATGGMPTPAAPKAKAAALLEDMPEMSGSDGIIDPDDLPF